MGELAEAKPKTEGVPLARKDFVHKQYGLRNLLQKEESYSAEATPSTRRGGLVPLPHLGEALRKQPCGAAPL